MEVKLRSSVPAIRDQTGIKEDRIAINGNAFGINDGAIRIINPSLCIIVGSVRTNDDSFGVIIVGSPGTELEFAL